MTAAGQAGLKCTTSDVWRDHAHSDSDTTAGHYLLISHWLREPNELNVSKHMKYDSAIVHRSSHS